MRLSTKSRYALEGLLYLAVYAPDDAVTTKQAAQGTQISVSYLEQIFFLLKKAGLLKTVRGAKGGFLLALEPQEITVGMVVRAIEGSFVPVACVEDISVCKSRIRDVCVSRKLWVQVSSAIENVVDRLTLEELADRFAKENGGCES